MGLIESPRHSRADLARWRDYADQDEARWLTVTRHRVDKARRVIADFVAGGSCYAGVSWGKDSVVLAHLVATTLESKDVPLINLRVEPLVNPDTDRVRDQFLARFPSVSFREITIDCPLDSDGWWDIDAKWDSALNSAGDRYMSGVRGSESGNRMRRMLSVGTTHGRVCTPIGWWTGGDIFAYLHRYDLPIHPAYAMSMDGILDRDRLRVDVLGYGSGGGFGRNEWERRYYGRELAMIEEERQCRLRR